MLLFSVVCDVSWDSFEVFVGEWFGVKLVGEIFGIVMLCGCDGMLIGDVLIMFECKVFVMEECGEGCGKFVVGILVVVLVFVGIGYVGWCFSDIILGFINGSLLISS